MEDFGQGGRRWRCLGKEQQREAEDREKLEIVEMKVEEAGHGGDDGGECRKDGGTAIQWRRLGPVAAAAAA